nr:hypothetical protein [Legionella maioricensis]
MTQDQVIATVDSLQVHDSPVELIKILDGQKLQELTDPSQFPRNITNRSKVYFSAHGREELDNRVLNKRSGDVTVYDLNEVAAYFGRALESLVFKDPHVKPRLTLVMCVCEGVGFAKKLQKKLFSDYGLFIDVVANKNVVHERYSKNQDDNSINISQRETSIKGVGREHQRPHSKVLLTIDETGAQKEIDAYELKWIENVHNTIHNQMGSFMKWADFNKPENIAILKGITTLCNDIDAIVVTFIEEDISLTANNLLALLRSCGKTTADSDYKDAMKYKTLTMMIPSLIQQGIKCINLNHETQDFLSRVEQIESREKAAVQREVAQNILLLKKADISTLLLEASEKGIDGVLSKIEGAREELSRFRGLGNE